MNMHCFQLQKNEPEIFFIIWSVRCLTFRTKKIDHQPGGQNKYYMSWIFYLFYMRFAIFATLLPKSVTCLKTVYTKLEFL